MSKANPLEAKTVEELEKMKKDKDETRLDHLKHANKLAKEIAAIEREIENRELKAKIAELEKQAAAAKATAKK